ncbi:MAG: hypothetical protein ACREDD_03545 [Methylocella sp.]
MKTMFSIRSIAAVAGFAAGMVAFGAPLAVAQAAISCSGVPMKPNCHGQCVSSLAKKYGGIDSAASTLMYSSVAALQNAIDAYCSAAPVPTGSCQPSSSLSTLASGTNVTAYVPKGNWEVGTTGVSVINVEGTSITPALIPTVNVVNSCASNSVTGETVCTANNTDVYLLSGTTLNSTLTSGGSGLIQFTGGFCTNCGVAMDAVNNKALISLSVAEGTSNTGGFQILDLATSTFGTAFPSPAPGGPGLPNNISEDSLIIPVQPTPPLPAGITLPLLLSASESNNYEIAGNAESASPAFFENSIMPPTRSLADSSGADCSTGIALAPFEVASPSLGSGLN